MGNYWNIRYVRPTLLRYNLGGKELTKYHARIIKDGGSEEMEFYFLAKLYHGPHWLRSICSRPISSKKIAVEAYLTFKEARP